MKKLENWVLPIVHSEKVKKCMQLAVERVWHNFLIARALNNCNTALLGERKEVNIRTIEEYLNIFTDLGDCDFENPLCINSFFKELIDMLLIDIDERTVLNIFNNAYAIALHALNNDYPEYSIGDYSDIITKTSPNIITQEMVLAMVLTLTNSNKDTCRAFNILADKYNIRKQHLIAGRIRKTFLVIEKYHLQLYNIDQIGELDHSQSMKKIQLRKKKAETLDELKAIINGMVPQQQGVAPTYTLLDAIIRYAEALPADECSAIRAIGRMLHAKGAAGRYIPTEVYQQYEQRIDKLANCTRPEQATKDDNEEKNTAKDETPPPDAGELDADEKDKRIKSAIEEWLKGGKRDKSHWFAVFKALVVRNLKADDMKNFCKQMYEWGYTKEQLTYCSVSKASQMYLPDKPSEWITMQRTAKGKELNMIKAFVAFAECLRNQGL